MVKKSWAIYCPSCVVVAINGLACHEIGCPNTHVAWIKTFGMILPENAVVPSRHIKKRKEEAANLRLERNENKH